MHLYVIRLHPPVFQFPSRVSTVMLILLQFHLVPGKGGEGGRDGALVPCPVTGKHQEHHRYPYVVGGSEGEGREGGREGEGREGVRGGEWGKGKGGGINGSVPGAYGIWRALVGCH